MKKLLVALVTAAMLLSVCLVPVTALDNHMDFSQLQPAVGVRVNGNWYIADLTPYKGESNVWVEVPIDASKLNSGVENYFSLRTNVNAGGDFCDTSADLYATARENASGSFLCSDPWCDNGYTMYTDRQVNIKIQIDRGSGWETIGGDAAYNTDHHTVLGQFQGGDWYNAARNIVLPAFSGVIRARVLVNMHVGKDIVPMASFAGMDGYSMSNLGWIFSNDPAVRVRVNGTWYGTDLTSYVGQDNAWVNIPIDLSVLRANTTNYIQFSSNVQNNGNMDASSADVLFTAGTAGNSFLTQNQWCDDGWIQLTDRILNARIELYDGRQWVAIPTGETYGQDATTVLGQFQGGDWYNFARNVDIGDVDLSQYQGARIAINMHVGANIRCAPYCIWDFANFREPTAETPCYTVTATAGEGGTVSGVPTERVLEGDPVTLTATPHTDYVFLGWYNGENLVSNANPYTFNVTGDLALTARFQYVDPTVYYHITATAGEGGTVTGAPTDRVPEGTQLTLTAVPDAGYRFDGWYNGETKVSDSLQYSFSATADVDLIARFTRIPTYTVTAAATQGGTVSGVPAEAVLEGTSVTLTATAQEGFKFAGWFAGDTLVSADASYTFTVSGNVTLEARFLDASHKTTPDTPGAATSTADSTQAAVKVRVNGFWYGTYLEGYKGQNDVWVPVYIPIEKLNANTENYFNVSSNVMNHGNFTDSSVDIYATSTDEDQQSFLTNHQWCDEGWVMFNDRNINIKLQVFDGTRWITLTPNETPCFDEHTVVGQFVDDGNWYNFARNMQVGDLSGYLHARVLVHMNVGSKLDVADDYVEENFATFLENPAPGTGEATPVALLAVLMVTAAAGFVLTAASKKRF